MVCAYWVYSELKFSLLHISKTCSARGDFSAVKEEGVGILVQLVIGSVDPEQVELRLGMLELEDFPFELL